MVNKDSQQIYGEVDALVTLLNYQVTNSGCCKVVLHPTWGSGRAQCDIISPIDMEDDCIDTT
jgi:hypothetical protein